MARGDMVHECTTLLLWLSGDGKAHVARALKHPQRSLAEGLL